MVGNIGTILGNFNRDYFGYVGFIYPIMLLIPTIFAVKDEYTKQRQTEITLASLLLLFSLLILQAHVIDDKFKGEIGFIVVDFLYGYIGSFGIWIFILFSITLSIGILTNLTVEDIILFTKATILKIKKELEKIEGRDKFISVKSVVSKKEIEHKKRVKNLNFDKKKIKSSNNSTNSSLNDSKKEVENKLKSIKEESQKLSSYQTPKSVEFVKELAENKKYLEQIDKGTVDIPTDFKLPPLTLLQSPPKKRPQISGSEIDKKINDLLEKLKQFKIDGDIVRTYSGPIVTTFEFLPAPHIKISKILNLQDDLAMALKAQTIRMQAPIPGKNVVGIEIPNKSIQTISLKEVLESKIYQESRSELTLVLGKDIVGNPFVTDLKKLPHLLIAGTTGSGKSVGINSMLISLLYKNSPDQLKLLMIDPKLLEFSVYNDIPHLLTPVITSPKQAIIALSNMVSEMERRYKLMSKAKTKNIDSYNKKAKKEGFEKFPYIVVIIDELADLMMTSGKDVEFYIARLAQMARASGIHLIVATQRPSVDVVTGLIKANLPSRISFRVGTKTDSKVILDSTGAESLLGRGDMLFTPPESSGLIRLHAPFVTESEMEKVVEFLKAQREAEYDESYLIGSDSLTKESKTNPSEPVDDNFDPLYDEAKNIILTDKKTSISYLQRKLQIGYNRSAKIIEQLEMMGVLSAPNAKGQREIL